MPITSITRRTARILGILVSLFVLVALPHAISACSCAQFTAAQDFNRADSVFIGKMLKGTEKFTSKAGDGSEIQLEAGAVTFQVQELFKGNIPTEVPINIASMRGTSCGDYGLRRGEVYIVWAFKDDSNNGHLYSGVCTRTTVADAKYAEDDLKFLRNLPPVGSGGNIEGRIWLDVKKVSGGSAEPIEPINVEITGEDGKLVTVRTDKQGAFSLKGLKVGTYNVRPKLPSGFVLDEDEDESLSDGAEQVQVNDRGTATAGFEVYYDAQVLGRLTDKAGTPVNDFMVQVESVSRSANGHQTDGFSDEDGTFDVKAIPPGRYLLYIEIQRKDSDDGKKYYYPGTFVRQEATPINVAIGSRVGGFNFTLPEGFRARRISGQVFWKNGKPASGVNVALACGTSTRSDGLMLTFMSPRTETDENGKFEIQGYSGEKYIIEVMGRSGKESLHAVPKPVNPDKGDVRGAKLVLSEPGMSVSCDSPAQPKTPAN